MSKDIKINIKKDGRTLVNDNMHPKADSGDTITFHATNADVILEFPNGLFAEVENPRELKQGPPLTLSLMPEVTAGEHKYRVKLENGVQGNEDPTININEFTD